MKPKVLKVQHEGKEIEVIAAQDGMPICVYPDGTEKSFDVPHAVSKIKEVSDDRDTWRGKAETHERTLQAYTVDGKPLDVAKAKEALALVGNIDRGKLKDAEEVERIKSEAQAALTTQITELKTSHAAEMAKLRSGYEGAILGEKLAVSEYLNKSTNVIPDFAREAWGPHRLLRDAEGRVIGGSGFDFENGKIVAYADGKKLFGKKPGEYAEVDEALEHFVGAHPQKDRLLKGVGPTGSGNPPSSPGGGAISNENATPRDLIAQGLGL